MPWKIERRKDKFVVVRENGKVVAEHDSKAKAMRQMRALYASEYWMKKARPRQFASRSEAGRYAAHIRWANQRGQEPLSVEAWRAQETGGQSAITADSDMAEFDRLRTEAVEAMRLVSEIDDERLMSVISGSPTWSAQYERLKTPDEQATFKRDMMMIVPPDQPFGQPKSQVRINGEAWSNASPAEREAMYLEASKQALQGVGNPPIRSNFILIEGFGKPPKLHAQSVPAQHMVDATEAVKKVGAFVEQQVANEIAKLSATNRQIDQQMSELAQTKRNAQNALRVANEKAQMDMESLKSELISEAWRNGYPRKGFNRRDHPLYEKYTAGKKEIKQSVSKAQQEVSDAINAYSDLMKQTTGIRERMLEVRLEALARFSPPGKDVTLPPIKASEAGQTSPWAKRTEDIVGDVLRELPNGVGQKFSTTYKDIMLTQSMGGGSFSKIDDPTHLTKPTAVINLPFKDDSLSMSTRSVATHEVMHGLEFASPTVHSLVATFRASRLYSYDPVITTRDTIPFGQVGHVVHNEQRPFSQRVSIIQSPLGHDATVVETGGGASSMPDKFGDPYAGRVYSMELVTINGQATSNSGHLVYNNEQLTVGVQGFLYGSENRSRFQMLDTDHTSFALGTMIMAADI